MALDLEINGLGGDELCVVKAQRDWIVSQVKQSIHEAIDRHPREQRLLLMEGTVTELEDDQSLRNLPTGRVVALNLLKRDPKVAEWLEHFQTFSRAWMFHSMDVHVHDAPVEVRRDYKAMLAAVQLCGDLMKHASEELRADRSFALACVGTSASSFRFIAPDLALDKNFVLAAIYRNKQVFDFVNPIIAPKVASAFVKNLLFDALPVFGAMLATIATVFFLSKDASLRFLSVFLSSVVLNAQLESEITVAVARKIGVLRQLHSVSAITIVALPLTFTLAVLPSAAIIGIVVALFAIAVLGIVPLFAIAVLQSITASLFWCCSCCCPRTRDRRGL